MQTSVRNTNRLLLLKRLHTDSNLHDMIKLITHKADPPYYYIGVADSHIHVSAEDGTVLYYETPDEGSHELINDFEVDDKLGELAI